MSLKVVITGAGIISAAGIGWKETSESLKSGRVTGAPPRFFDTVHDNIPCFEVPYTDSELRRMCGIAEDITVPRSSLLGILAAREAADMAGLRDAEAGIAFINGTTVGGIDVTERNLDGVLSGEVGSDVIECHCDGVTSRIIADAIGVDIIYKDVISTACSAAANAIALGAELIRSGRADIVIAGGAECISKYHFNGFNTLMILDSRPCRPFDAGRGGLNLGEGAGYVVLESCEFAAMRGAVPIAELSGWGNACDAYHQTATSAGGTGAVLSMGNALKCAGLQPSEIDYINAHGTGTQNNDLSEGIAIQTLFRGHIPMVSSTKGYTGHPTSAAAGVEAVISLISLKEGFVPANLRFQEKIAELDFSPVSELVEGVRLRHILSNSFGFGGNDSTLIFSAPGASYGREDGEDECGDDERLVYVSGAAVLSAAAAGNRDDYRPCVEPDCKGLISPLAARRLGKVIKRTYFTIARALEEAGVKMPDAIITGTGLGCTGDTLIFLKDMLRSGEALLKPSHFINSTPNTIGSQIAILLGCNGLNDTHVNDGMAFEGALLESYLLLGRSGTESVLLSAADETPEELYGILRRHPSFAGRCISEGASSFVLTHNPEGAYASLDDIRCIMLPDGTNLPHGAAEEYLKRIFSNFLAANGLKPNDIDLMFVDCRAEERGRCFPFLPEAANTIFYKEECGEYMTAAGYGFYKAARMLKDDSTLNHAVILSQRCGREYSFILLSGAGRKSYV